MGINAQLTSSGIVRGGSFFTGKCLKKCQLFSGELFFFGWVNFFKGLIFYGQMYDGNVQVELYGVGVRFPVRDYKSLHPVVMI